MSNEQLLGSRQRQFIDGLPEHSTSHQLDPRNSLSEEYTNLVLNNSNAKTHAKPLRAQGAAVGSDIAGGAPQNPVIDKGLAGGDSQNPVTATSTAGGDSQNPVTDRSTAGGDSRSSLAADDAKSGAVALSDKATGLTLPKAKAAFSQEHKISISAEHDKFVYSMQYEGTRHKLFETSADQKGLDSASQMLKSMVADEEKSLTAAYGVSFAQAGELVAKQKETSEGPDSGHAVLARDPEVFELKGIRAALEKVRPATSQPTVKPASNSTN